MSELDAEYVKHGYWVNLEQGSVLGQTITTNTRTGAVVIALLAVLTSLGLTHLWHLLTFFYHQIRADGQPSDGLFRHQQALLRTLPTPGTLLADSLKLWFTWRDTSDRALQRSLLHTFVSLLFIAGSLAVSIFSSYVVSSANMEVLVSSPYCGSLSWNVTSWESYDTASIAAAESYGPDCYQKTSLPSKCNIYHRPNVPYTVENTSCPFDTKMCASHAVVLDSGLVDVHDAFGVNLDNKDRVRYRKKTTCSVLTLNGYTRIVNASSFPRKVIGRAALPNEDFIQYRYGPYDPADPNGSTWVRSLYAANLTSTLHSSWNAPSIPELKMENADVMLRLTELNAIRYRTPVDDPMFAAHKPVELTGSIRGEEINFTMYMSDSPGSVMGCGTQYQHCYIDLTGRNFCSELSRNPAAINETFFPGANEVQLAQLTLLVDSASIFHISGPSRYKAEVELSNNYGAIESLPNDQWIKELQDWESITWAGHQIMFADYAIGPTVRDPFAKSYTVPPKTGGERALCKAQKMRKPGGFVNINYFGLIFAVTVSCIIIIIDLGLLRFLTFIRKLKKSPSPRLDRWTQDGIYQLQRHAYEAQGESVWKDLTAEIPITVENTMLQDLYIQPTSASAPLLDESCKEEKVLKEDIEHRETVHSAQMHDEEVQDPVIMEDHASNEFVRIVAQGSRGSSDLHRNRLTGGDGESTKSDYE